MRREGERRRRNPPDALSEREGVRRRKKKGKFGFETHNSRFTYLVLFTVSTRDTSETSSIAKEPLFGTPVAFWPRVRKKASRQPIRQEGRITRLSGVPEYAISGRQEEGASRWM
jgi:hypothetical protein